MLAIFHDCDKIPSRSNVKAERLFEFMVLTEISVICDRENMAVVVAPSVPWELCPWFRQERKMALETG